MVAIFGDIYARDNDVMNQNLIRTIEENGGEVVTTPYNEFMKIIAEPYFRKWFAEGHYSEVATGKILYKTIQFLEKKYYRYFNQIINDKPYQPE